MDELRPEETRIVQVNSDGRAEYRFTLVLGCVCTLELDDYPFDTQSCRTQFFVYQHKPETMRIVGQIRLSDDFLGNDVWEFRNVSTTKGPMYYDSPLYGPTLMNMIGIGIGVLTSMTLILTIVAHSVPKKKSISVLATFIIANIFVIAVAIVVVVINPSRIIVRLIRRCLPKEQSKPISIILETDQPPQRK
ncbi:hypothetical protein PRIPAC_82422 [Pristionchus pacificus]|nr:hypothetical protein PRIPAC_82422 [Pristionchus pacificus]